MKQDSARIAVSALTLIIAVNAWIQCSTASSEPNVLSGSCQETDGRKRYRDTGTRLRGDKGVGEMEIVQWGDGVIRRLGDNEME